MSEGDALTPHVPRVLQFVPGFRSGGIESLVLGIYSCLDKEKLQFDVIVDTTDSLPEFDEIRSSGGRVFQTGHYLDNPLRYQQIIHDILRRHGHEYLALHSHTIIRALPVLWAARHHGIKRRILHSHTDSLQGSWQAYAAPAIAAMTVPLATDYWACSEAAGRFFFGQRGFKIFRNTIDCEGFTYDSKDRARVRQQLGIDSDTLLVGHTGRFTYQKNHDWLIRVFAELHHKRADARLVLVGEGPLESESRELAAAMGVAKAVFFVGLQSNVSSYLSAMDVFLLPSHFEGFCISLLEAQVNGLPCLTSSVIPDEVRVTPSVTTCDLDKEVSEWSNHLIDLHRQGRANSAVNTVLIRQAGYDTKSQLNELVSMYHSR